MAKREKAVKQKEVPSALKSPRHIENPDSFYEKAPVWSFRLLDNDLGREN